MKKFCRVRCLGFVCLGALMSFAYGAQPQRLVVDDFKDFVRGESKGVAIRTPGQLEVGPKISFISELEDKHLWDVARQGNSTVVYVGTGPEGELYRVSSEGGWKLETQFSESDIYAVASKGMDIYAATSPNGKIFRIRPGQEPEVYFEPKEEYVWAMVFDEKGVLYAATGSEGRIYRIEGKGQGEVYYDSDEAGIRSLAFDSEGHLLAGTTENGLVYQIERKGKAVVLLEASKPEIRTLMISPAGEIWVLAIGATQMAVPSKKPAEPKVGEIAETKGVIEITTASIATGKLKKAALSAQKKSGTTVRGKGSAVYVLRKDLYPELIWEEKDQAHSMIWHDGGGLVGLGDKGMIYRVFSDGECSLWTQVESEQVTGLLSFSKSRVMALTSNVSKAFILEQGAGERGKYLTEVIDSKLFAKWGAVRVEGRKGSWNLRTRSGNTSDPDKSWYGWQALKNDKIMSPSARYLQVEIEMQAGEIERLEINFQPRNQPPSVKNIKVLPCGIGYVAVPMRPQQEQPQTAKQLLSVSKVPMAEMESRYQPVRKSGLRSVVWNAEDANQDELVYDLDIRKDEEKKWQSLASAQCDPIFSWDTSGWEDGAYVLRVTASDAPSNVAAEVMKGEAISKIWYIDHTPPELSLLNQSGKSARVRVREATSLIQAVSVSRNGCEYEMVLPEDGILDSRDEIFEVKIEEGVLYFRAEDASGNVNGLRINP